MMIVFIDELRYLKILDCLIAKNSPGGPGVCRGFTRSSSTSLNNTLSSYTGLLVEGQSHRAKTLARSAVDPGYRAEKRFIVKGRLGDGKRSMGGGGWEEVDESS